MTGNPEFEKAMKDMLGNANKLRFCPECGAEYILCQHCKEATCPNECEPTI